jgi:multidrug resistance efflux pump
VPFDQARLNEIAKRPGTDENLQPGDDVVAGQVLAKFDTHDIELKKIEAEARVARFDIDYRRLMAERDNGGKDQTAEALSAMKQRDAAQAEANLAGAQIERASVKATIAGRIMSGDLRDKLGSTMKQGEPLFEIAEVGKLRVEIELNERDVQRVRDASNPKGGSIGDIKTNSQPSIASPIVIDRIVPNEQPKEGQNTFSVFAHVDLAKVDKDVMKDWSPGQRGEASIHEEPRTLMYQWTHRLVDWARLKLWIF